MAKENKKAPNKNVKGFEESLWDAANKLRGSVESSEYKHIVLSLIFLKFISDKFNSPKKQYQNCRFVLSNSQTISLAKCTFI